MYIHLLLTIPIASL